MKLIGIMGKPGSGKTTFSDYLGCKDTVGVIHVDDLVADIKKKYFKFFLQPKENNKTENVKNNPKLKAGIKEKFYKNKFLFNILMKLRTKLIEKELLKKIEDFKLDGKEITIIDDWALPYQNKIFHKLDKIYTLERDFLERRDGLKQRDALTVRELRVCDIPYSLEHIKLPEGENVVKILNKGSMKELKEQADREYEKIGMLSFDERYSIKSQINLANIAKTVNQANKIMTREKVNEKD